MIRIMSVASSSPAAGAGIRPGESIVSINGEPVLDEIDYQELDTMKKRLDYIGNLKVFVAGSQMQSGSDYKVETVSAYDGERRSVQRDRPFRNGRLSRRMGIPGVYPPRHRPAGQNPLESAPPGAPLFRKSRGIENEASANI